MSPQSSAAGQPPPRGPPPSPDRRRRRAIYPPGSWTCGKTAESPRPKRWRAHRRTGRSRRPSSWLPQEGCENRADGDGMSQSHRSGDLAFCAVRAHIVAVRQLLPCMPSLGVSSLDLGRSFTGAASFFCKSCFCEPFQALAASRRQTSSWLSLTRTAPRSSSSCGRLVALAIGAVSSGLARSQASATCAVLALCADATSSRAASTRNPLSSRYLVAPAPRGLLPASFFERYFPVRNPLASE